MKLRHLRIERFRCIKSLDWLLGTGFVCLVGPGDSGKSTILDAIDLVLSPRWNPVFDDTDFHLGNTSEPLIIEATIGELPRRLLSDGQFGLRLRGLSTSGVINDEPQDGDEEVVTIRLTVDSSLEPEWGVVTDRHPEGAPIHAKQREQLGVVRLGAVVDRHLSWNRGSVLARLTGDTAEHADLLADAGRMARGSMDLSKVPKLDGAARQAAALAAAFGVRPTVGFRPGLDPGTSTLTSGGLSLHDGVVPLRRAGLGTRRLVALAIEREIACEGGVVLVDEVEHGLEPFRLRRLLRELLEPSTPGTKEVEEAGVRLKPGGVIVTTHSPVVLGELTTEHLRVVRSGRDTTTILSPGVAVQSIFRTNPEAFLSRRVVVCEGKTEMGVLRGLDRAWAAHGEPFAARGVALADGGGSSKVGGMASIFASLGYPTAILADADVPLDVDPAALRTRGILVVQWDGALAIEQRAFADLPWAGVVQAVRVASDAHGDDAIRAHVATALKASTHEVPEDVAEWPSWRPEHDVRVALGVAAKSKRNEWFKRVDLGAALGGVIARHLSDVEESDLALKLRALREWVVRV